jgi:uncharacterized protein (TIGR00661 family)
MPLMARILYAAAGDGYGHATRAHSVGAGLLARGHDVRFLGSLKSSSYLKEHFPGLVDDIFGLLCCYRGDRISAFETVKTNVLRSFTELRPCNETFLRVTRGFEPELIISDFEPFSAFWAQWLGYRYISLDNQHLLTHCRVDRVSGEFRSLANAWATIRFYYANAHRYLITTFIQAPIKHQPATIVPPVLRPAVYELGSTSEDFLLAYLGGRMPKDEMCSALESLGDVPVRAYNFGQTGRVGNVEYLPVSAEGFLRDLSRCAGVISSAGHSLLCECVYFRKPILVKPIAGQYEQVLNAHYVERLGLGVSVDRYTARGIHEFMDHLDDYRASMSGIPQVALDPVLDAIEAEVP